MGASRPAHHSSPWPPWNTSSTSPPVWRPGLRTGPPCPPAPGNLCAPVEGDWQCPPCSLLRLMQMIAKRKQHRQAENQSTEGLREREEEQRFCHVTNWTPDWSQRAWRNKDISLPLLFVNKRNIMKLLSGNVNFTPCCFSIYTYR